MIVEPNPKKAIVFIDGQNLFHCAKTAFGHKHPNYDVKRLSESICKDKGWELKQIRFYTGIPDPADNAHWHQFWSAKLAYLGKIGVHVYSRTLRYRNETIELSDGTSKTFFSRQREGN